MLGLFLGIPTGLVTPIFTCLINLKQKLPTQVPILEGCGVIVGSFKFGCALSVLFQLKKTHVLQIHPHF